MEQNYSWTYRCFLCSKIVGNYMKYNKKGGIIINIASEYSVITPDHKFIQQKVGKKNLNLSHIQ